MPGEHQRAFLATGVQQSQDQRQGERQRRPAGAPGDALTVQRAQR
jgi:hypothetical protein